MAGGDLPDPLRFHHDHEHLSGAFGGDTFGKKAEAFARFFGTPRFIIIQSGVVAVWIVINAVGLVHFDLYPFILLNLAFSTQAAYAAPLILLAQTRQADRDKAHAEADARHREEIAQRAVTQERQLQNLVEQNTAITQQIEQLTQEIHRRVTAS
ncbi:MAG: hypothetical protein QOJ31_1558 [Gaiellales bacterium]|nr:hypothetical protein [Gaiellales bacterium]MDX6550874.1 hypothetical protein [Gaiellales bacterium]